MKIYKPKSLLLYALDQIRVGKLKEASCAIRQSIEQLPQDDMMIIDSEVVDLLMNGRSGRTK